MFAKLKKLILCILDENENVFFVGSADKLVEPLSVEEEQKYVDLFLNGDMSAKNKLIEHNLRLVVFSRVLQLSPLSIYIKAF